MRKNFFLIIFILSIHSITYTQGYYIENIISGITQPNAFDFMPNGNYIVNEQTGKVKIFNSAGQLVSIFWDFTDSSFYYGEMGTLGIALDPNFNTNRNIYIYNVKGDALEFYLRIVKFTEVNNTGTNPQVIFSNFNGPGSSNTHAAGNLHFRTDGTLMFSVGTVQVNCSAQNINCPRGKILRINTDGSAPVTNPFYDDGNPNTGNDDRIWAYGFRNPYEFCISPFNDSIFTGENSSGPDEINYVRKGKNYGYPICTGICSNPLYTDPVLLLPSSTVPTGMIIYNGSAFPTLNNKLLFAGYNAGKIYKCDLGNPPYYDTIISYSEWVNTNIGEPNYMKQGSDGFIYLTVRGTGRLLRIKPDPTGIQSQNHPINFSLSQNYPNPFNPVTNIKYEIPVGSFVSMKIYNSLGVQISTLVNETKQLGAYEVTWDASAYPSGVYYYELSAGEFTEKKKMVLVK